MKAVKLRRRWTPLYLFAGLIALLGTLGVVFGIHLVDRRNEAVAELRESGTAATAVVYDERTTKGKNSKQLFALRYVSDGARTAWVECGYGGCPEIGETVQIWVDPADPARFVDAEDRFVAGDPANRDGVLPIIFGAMFALIGAASIVSLVVYGPRERPSPEFFASGGGEERLKRTNRRRHRRRR